MNKESFKKKAIESFNITWDYIEKANRTPEDILKMIDLA